VQSRESGVFKMWFASGCIICNCQKLTAYPAVVSPFIAQFAMRHASVHCSLCECSRCGHRFFDLRLDDQEMNRLYQDYYTESYLRARRYWEPWYTSDVNNSRADDPKDIESRRRGLSEFLKRYAPKDILAGSVLDYGGDRGQFIPLQIGDKKFVFEASHRSPTEGVVRLAARDSLQQQTFDLVLLSHVLEHIPEPHSFLRRMNVKSLARRIGATGSM